ncbi:MAG: GAF domain-containing protein [Cyclobacteriaceae bacterium]|nr:GAF domain-containing protein [Cyclobacteriaceae bacterium]
MKTQTLKLLFLISTLPGFAVAQTHHFEKLTEFHGLSDNRVTCFMKDRTGFMWIGTQNGLNRYDGHTFKIYRPGQKKQTLSHEHINDVEEDNDGRLWIATWNGLNVLDPKTDSLYVFSPDEDAYRQKKTKIASNMIWDSYIDKAGRIWLAPDARDLCYYDPIVDEFTYFPWREFVNTELPQYSSAYKSIHKIKRKSDHELWIGTTLGLFSFDIASKKFYYHGGEAVVDFVALEYDTLQQRVYFGQQKLFALDVAENIASEIKSSVNTTPVGQRAPSLLIPSLAGLWSVNKTTLQATLLPQNSKNSFTLHHEPVNTVFVDRDLVWVGGASGITLYDNNLNIFPFVRVFPETVSPKPGSIYFVLDHDRDDAYYISSYTENCLIIIDKKSGDRQVVSTIQGKPLLKCTKIIEDSQQRLWILTEKSIFISDPTHRHFSMFPFPATEDNYRFVDMVEDTEGNFWFASLSYGIYQYTSKNNSWKFFEQDPNSLFTDRPTGLLLDPTHHALWIADFSFGVFRHDLITKAFKYHGMNSKDPRFLQSSLSNALALDKEGNVWVATTSGGVSKYLQDKKEFITYSMESGLPENSMDAIQADLHGNVWLASNKGLTHIKPNGEVIRHYDQNSGLPYNNFNTPFSTNARGEVMIGMRNGFLKFHPDSLVVRSADFPVVITLAQQGNRAIDSTVPHQFSYNQNEFTFHYAALTYSLPGEVTYFYMLEGYDKNWINPGHDHTARYTNLSDGAYTFLVRAIDHSGKPSANVARISFSIYPPFWKQVWFLALLVIIGSTSIYLWIRSLQRKIQSQKILNQVATSLYGQNTIEGIFWTVAKNCIELLHFEDCVVYLHQEDRGVLIQKAAAGPKSQEPYQILNPMEIKIGKGIVGSVALHGKAEIIRNTTKDNRYIVDDQPRFSEIAVPILVEGKVFGVIDSEHPQKNYYRKWHLHMVTEIAAICSVKIERYFIEEQIRSKVARDLHDDMGSTLSSIKIMSNIALEKNDPVAAQTYLKTIRQNANTMQESMSDMVWAINPENDTLEKVIIRMKEFAAEILEPLDIQYEFLEDGDFSRSKMDLATRKDFFLIFKEAVNNAAKYSQCKTFTVELKRYAHGIMMRIRDDGNGFDASAITGGNGIKNMKYRAGTIKASLQIESVSGAGTTIQLETPIT